MSIFGKTRCSRFSPAFQSPSTSRSRCCRFTPGSRASTTARVTRWSEADRTPIEVTGPELGAALGFLATVLAHRNPLAGLRLHFEFDLGRTGRFLIDGGARFVLLAHHHAIFVPDPRSTLRPAGRSVHVAAGAVDAELDELLLRRVVAPIDVPFHLRHRLGLLHLPLSDHPVTVQVLLDGHRGLSGLLAAHLGGLVLLARALPGTGHAVEFRQLRGWLEG